MVYDIHTIITRIPGQVEHQQHVYLLDELGKRANFNLGFIRSKKVCTYPKLGACNANTFKAFLNVLEDNMRHVKDGPGIITRGEFVIQESRTKRLIDLSRDWNNCFLLGQRVEMSIAFQRPSIGSGACPGCKATPRLLRGKMCEMLWFFICLFIYKRY